MCFVYVQPPLFTHHCPHTSLLREAILDKVITGKVKHQGQFFTDRVSWSCSDSFVVPSPKAASSNVCSEVVVGAERERESEMSERV